MTARKPADPTKSKAYRVDRGLCPMCGEEAAPYYMCHEHRNVGMMRRMLNGMAARGEIQKHKEGRFNSYSIPRGWTPAPEVARDARSTNGFEMHPDDKRLRPRMGRRPIDIDETLISIFRDAGRPLHMDEVYAAWGKLRSKRKNGTLAADMRALIEAQRRREAKNAKRATCRSERAP